MMCQVKIISTGEIQSTKSYTTPTKTGLARIVDAQVQDAAIHLIIQTTGGTQYDFDVNAGKFTAR